MPTYEYHCGSCGELQEHVCSYKDKPRAVPCECGSRAESIPSVTALSVPRYNRYGNRIMPKGFNPLPGPLRDSDGKNRIDYQSTKVTVDSGNRSGNRHQSRQARIKTQFMKVARSYRDKKRKLQEAKA